MITIVDYGVGNAGSLQNMIKRIGAKSVLSSSPEVVVEAEKIILPGVGAFDAAMESLNRLGLSDALRIACLSKGIPLLGICLGMHVLTKSSEEGRLPGLGIIDAVTTKFTSTDGRLIKVPHMGWNSVSLKRDHQLVKGLEGSRYYFVHSYKVQCRQFEDVVATTNYGEEFVSIFARGNVCAAQFHPEKSHRFGLSLLKNFVEM